MAAPSFAASSKFVDPLQTLRDALAKPDGAPLICLTGSERFLLDRAVDLIKEAVLQPATRDFNYDQLQAKEAGVPRILACARTLPMMAKKRLVLVRDASTLSAADLAQLVGYVQAPSPETCLVLLAEDADLRTKFYLTFQKHGLLLKLAPLPEKQLAGFVEAEARRMKVGLEAGAAAAIADEIGADLAQLVDALERLSCYVAVGAKVRVADVEEVVATTRQHSVFELIDAVGSRNRGEALRLLSGMLGAQEPALRLLAMLARHVRQLWQTEDALSHGAGGPGDVASLLGLHPFVAGKLVDQARRLSADRIGRMHEAIYQTDRSLKLSKIEDLRVMETLLLRLCTG